jgi:hypothetical protein
VARGGIEPSSLEFKLSSNRLLRQAHQQITPPMTFCAKNWVFSKSYGGD